MESSTTQLVEHLFRTESGRLIAILTKIFGASNIQLAEDVVQDTLIAALNSWSTGDVPDNPSAWLMQVAKRKAINELEKLKCAQKGNKSFLPEQQHEQAIEDLFLNNEIEDSQLKMIFVCCHPSLSTTSQISLILKTLCGFGVREVANSLLTNETAINKKLYRAKSIIREKGLSFTIPSGIELEKQLQTVCLTLYLMFNEGYNASASSNIIRKDLCFEAMRLVKLLSNHFPEHKELHALFALMCFHAARFEARISNTGAIIVFEEQDRSLWNRALITAGMYHLNKSSNAKKLTSYHLEAGIVAEYCLAESFEETNWKSIYDQYRILYQLKPTPVIKLNLAITLSKLEGEAASLKLLEELIETALDNYYLLPATQGIFHMKLGHYQTAIPYLEKAIRQTASPVEKSFLAARLSECNAKGAARVN